ncbi:MAG: hypothetical protein HUJ63_06170, partial [Enterococcus sp.]|nr:hypothetical protein [Enterococcus sp.]
GMTEDDMVTVAEAIKLVLIDGTTAACREATALVEGLTEKYPLYQD